MRIVAIIKTIQNVENNELKKLKKVLDKRKRLWYIRWAVAEIVKKKSQRTLIIEQYNQPWRFLKKPDHESGQASEIFSVV